MEANTTNFFLFLLIYGVIAVFMYILLLFYHRKAHGNKFDKRNDSLGYRGIAMFWPLALVIFFILILPSLLLDYLDKKIVGADDD